MSRVEDTPAPAKPLVLHEKRDGVLLMTLNRPEVLNAWNRHLEREFFEGLAQAEYDEDVRVIVVTGAGRAFCAGVDMSQLSKSAGTGVPTAAADGPAPPKRPRHFITELQKPVIAAINGACAGIGLVIALTCDLRFAAADAKITTAFVRRGLIAELGISWLLPRLVGQANALDLLLSGRVVRGEEAEGMGLVNKALPAGEVLEHALAYARVLAENCSPSAMAVIKSQVYRHLETGFGAALNESTFLMVQALGGEDSREGALSYREKRLPRFKGLAVRRP